MAKGVIYCPDESNPVFKNPKSNIEEVAQSIANSYVNGANPLKWWRLHFDTSFNYRNQKYFEYIKQTDAKEIAKQIAKYNKKCGYAGFNRTIYVFALEASLEIIIIYKINHKVLKKKCYSYPVVITKDPNASHHVCYKAELVNN